MDDLAPLRITEAELVTLLLLNPGESTRRTAAVLGLEPQLDNGEIDRAGMQTLVVRDLGVLDDGTFTAQGPAQLLGVVFASATEWLVTTVDGAEVRSAVVVVGSPQARLLFAITPSGVHEVRPITPDGDITEVARVLAASFDADEAYTKPLNVRVRRLTVDVEKAARFDVVEPGTWRYGATLLATTGSPDEVWPRVREALAP